MVEDPAVIAIMVTAATGFLGVFGKGLVDSFTESRAHKRSIEALETSLAAETSRNERLEQRYAMLEDRLDEILAKQIDTEHMREEDRMVFETRLEAANQKSDELAEALQRTQEMLREADAQRVQMSRDMDALREESSREKQELLAANEALHQEAAMLRQEVSKLREIIDRRGIDLGSSLGVDRRRSC